jgi:hypothetical protein
VHVIYTLEGVKMLGCVIHRRLQYYPHKPQEAPEPINYRRVSVGALLQDIEHDPLNNLPNVPVQTANEVEFQETKYAPTVTVQPDSEFAFMCRTAILTEYQGLRGVRVTLYNSALSKNLRTVAGIILQVFISLCYLNYVEVFERSEMHVSHIMAI